MRVKFSTRHWTDHVVYSRPYHDTLSCLMMFSSTAWRTWIWSWFSRQQSEPAYNSEWPEWLHHPSFRHGFQPNSSEFLAAFSIETCLHLSKDRTVLPPNNALRWLQGPFVSFNSSCLLTSQKCEFGIILQPFAHQHLAPAVETVINVNSGSASISIASVFYWC